MYIDMNTIVYLHCHQQGNLGATIVLVAQDGVQYPPIRFPKGSHLLQFLTCLEGGLTPNGQLDPPLWNDDGKGKVFPRLHRKSIKKMHPQMILTNQANTSIDSPSQQQQPQLDVALVDSNASASESVGGSVGGDSNSAEMLSNGSLNSINEPEDFVFRIVNSKANGNHIKKLYTYTVCISHFILNNSIFSLLIFLK
jgi:hypothetical protein